MEEIIIETVIIDLRNACAKPLKWNFNKKTKILESFEEVSDLSWDVEPTKLKPKKWNLIGRFLNWAAKRK